MRRINMPIRYSGTPKIFEFGEGFLFYSTMAALYGMPEDTPYRYWARHSQWQTYIIFGD